MTTAITGGQTFQSVKNQSAVLRYYRLHLNMYSMELNQTENDVLKLLADEWDAAGPPGYIETTTLAARLKISVPQVKSAVGSLFEKGLVDSDKVDTFAAYLTPEGYALARSG